MNPKTGVCNCDVPNIDVELSFNDSIPYTFTALIDSGCQKTNINADIADIFGIDLTKCPQVKIGGITGSAIGYEFSIDMKLKDFGEKFESPAIFVPNLPVPILLGQSNFFDKFDVKFEKRNNVFELKRIDMDKKSFISLLDKAISSPSMSQKRVKLGENNRKQIRLHKSVNTSTKQRGKFR